MAVSDRTLWPLRSRAGLHRLSSGNSSDAVAPVLDCLFLLHAHFAGCGHTSNNSLSVDKTFRQELNSLLSPVYSCGELHHHGERLVSEAVARPRQT